MVSPYLPSPPLADEHRDAWRHWIEYGPHGPIEDDPSAEV